MSELKSILADLKKGAWKPLYFLQGDEPYFMEVISDYIEGHALPESERAFNQSVLYGADVNPVSLLETLQRLPMMSERQIVILKQAQQMREFTDKMEAYLVKPVPTTVFVVNYVGKKLAKNTKLYKAMAANGVVFNSEKIQDYKLPEWITGFAKESGYKLDDKAAIMLAEFLGNDLARIAHSLEKLTMAGTVDTITPDHVEKLIGISKDFNAFELLNAMSEGTSAKVAQIVNYFGANPKACPFPMLTATLYTYFKRFLVFHESGIRDTRTLMSKFGMNYYAATELQKGATFFTPQRARRAVGILAEYDLRSKGVDSVAYGDAALMQEMLYKMMEP